MYIGFMTEQDIKILYEHIQRCERFSVITKDRMNKHPINPIKEFYFDNKIHNATKGHSPNKFTKWKLKRK